MPDYRGGLVNAKKQKDNDSDVAVLDTRARKKSGSRGLVVAGILLVLAAGAGYAVWQQVGPHVRSSGQYQLDPEQITITPPPAWIRSDIKAEALRDASFDGPLSLLDPELTVRVASALAAHPWVAHVERVSKRFPSGLDVVVSYRRPVAMVEVEDGASALPVDAEGIVLPTRDFRPTEAEDYPRIGEIHTTPSGSAGMRWGDAGVAGAAQIAAALGNEWKKLDLFRIVPGERKPGRSGVEYTFSLVTHSGTKVNWGRAPTTDLPGELPAAEKISQLKTYAAKNNGSLDDPEGHPHVIVISGTGALLSRSRREIAPIHKTGE